MQVDYEEASSSAVVQKTQNLANIKVPKVKNLNCPKHSNQPHDVVVSNKKPQNEGGRLLSKDTRA